MADIGFTPGLDPSQIDPATGLTGGGGSPFPDMIPLGPSRGKDISFYGGRGIGEGKFDEGILPAEVPFLDAIRASNQTTGGQAFNAVIGGVASGVLTAIEDISYILDFENNLNRIVGLEQVESNMVADIMKRGKQGLEKIMPIYRRKPEEVFDFTDPGFYFSSLKGILDSAVGFAIPGMAASKGVGMVQRAARLSKYLEMMKGSQTVQQMVNAGLSGYITNFGEGKMMALEQFENSLNEMKTNLFDENYARLLEENPLAVVNYPEINLPKLRSEAERLTRDQLAAGKLKEFESIAGEQANIFINRNKVFAITDAVGLHGIYKGKGLTRNLLKEGGLRAGAKRLTTFSSDNLLVQAGKEGLEEIGQNVLQMEGEYQAAKKAGIDVSETPDVFAERVYEFATSEKALLEGMMGLFGGGPQRIFTEGLTGNLGRTSRSEYKKKYAEQQDQVKRNTIFLNTKLGNYAKAQVLRAKAIATGQNNLDEIIKNSQFIDIVTENFIRGTTSNIERQLSDIADGVSEEQRVENDWDKDYQQQARDQLTELRRMEKQYNKFTRYENQADVFQNRESRRLLETERQTIQERLNLADDQLELQDVKDPDLLKDKEYLERQVKLVTEKIKERDSEYKKLTNRDYQAGLRNQKKETENIIKKNVEKNKADAKKRNAQDKANRKKDRTEVKKKTTKEPDVTVLAEEPDITPDPNKVREPDLDANIDPNTISQQEVDRMAEQDEQRRTFDGDTDTLFGDIDRDLDEISEALVEGEGLSKAQVRVGRLENLMDNLKVINGTDDVTFEDLILALIERKGMEKLERYFGTLEAINKMRDPNYKLVGDLKEFLKLTNNEQRAKDADDLVSKQNSRDQYTTSTDEDIKNIHDDVETDVQKTNSTKESGLTFDYLKVESASGILAYLSRKYEHIRTLFTRGYKEIRDDLNEEMHKDVLDPNKYVVGTEVVLRIEDLDDTPVYDTEAKNMTTWGAKKDKWRTQTEVTQNEFDRLYNEQVPIAVYVGDEKIGYLHAGNWINEENVSGDVVQDKKRNKNIRDKIVADGEYTTKISSRTNGYLFRASDDRTVTTAEAMPDQELPILVGSQGDLKSSRSDRFSGDLLNKKEFKEGVAYIVIPVGTHEQIAIPLLSKKLGEEEAVIDTIMTALEIFYSTEHTPEQLQIIDSIEKEIPGINITTNNGITDFIEMFVNNYNIGTAENLETYLGDKGSYEQLNDAFLSMFRRDEIDDVQFEMALGRGLDPVSLSKASIENISEDEMARRLAKIREHLGLLYSHTSLDHLEENKQVVTIDEDGKVIARSYKEHVRQMTKTPFLAQNIGTEEDPNWVYTIQPVIEMDFSEIDGSQKTKEKQRKEDVKAAKEPKIPAPKLPKAPKAPKYKKFVGGMNPTTGEAASEAAVPPTVDELAEIKKKAEVEVKGKAVAGILITELGSTKQSQLVDYMRSKIVEQVFKKRKIKRDVIFEKIKEDFTKNAQIAKDNLIVAEESEDQAGVDYYTRWVGEFELVTKNWDKLVGLTNDQIKRIDAITVVKADEDEGLTEEQVEAQRETNNWSDDKAFTTPPSDNLAPQVKQFLSGITEYTTEKDESGDVLIVPNTNYLGLPSTMAFQDVYNMLQRLTPNLKADYNEIINALKMHTEAFPFVEEVIVKLEAAPQQLKNLFVSNMTNHYIDMRFIMFGRTESGAYELREHQSNANAMAQVVQTDWYKNLILRSGIPLLEDREVLAMPDELRQRLMSTYEKWVEKDIYPENEVRKWLSEFGIDLSDETFRQVVDGQFEYGGQKWGFKKLIKDGFFKYSLYNNIKRRGTDSLYTNTIIEQTAIKRLARMEAANNMYSFSNSHRSGTKTIYSYGQNKFLINRLRELKEFNDDGRNPLIEQLAALSFNGQSEWIELLQQNKGDNAFVKNFNYWIASLEPLKKKGAKSRDKTEMHNLSEAEIEVIKIGMLQASRSDVSGENNRVIQVLYPTTSDKSTVIGLRVLAQALVLDTEGNIKDESLDVLVDRLVLPEYNRILSYQNKKDKGDHADIKEYRKGAEQFLFFPLLNKVPGMFINDSINPDLQSLMPTIKEKVKEYFTSLVNDKVENWEENGIGGTARSFLHSGFMNVPSLAKSFKDHPLRPVNSRDRVRGAATDMVFQYLIANAEISKVFTGDPALYFDQSEKNEGKAKTNPEYDFIADAKKTFVNIGKRLAADIAPGYEIADAANNRYTQAFGIDSKSSSERKLQITELLDGKDAANKVREGGSVKGLISEPYYDFQGTDAQEYTTWKEHLYVMKQAGEITEEEHDEASKILSKGGRLTKAILSKVLQPMKPVYVDNKVEEGSDVERRVYIKTSAFPLLPQLTARTDLDNLRIAMEDQNIDRFVYSTGVKVGNFSNPVNIFDEKGRIMKADQISFTDSQMTLSRKGFRIQQRVPYDPKKAVINKVTQASKNLFINMLNVEGFSVPWYKDGESVTGAELQKEYHRIYEQLHKDGREFLLNELGYDEERNVLDLDKLRTLLKTEAKVRNYPISDQELLELDEELRFLPFSPSANKYEALLNSIVTNRIIRIQFPGKSYVLGSEEGFQTRLGIEEARVKIDATEGIIFTDGYNGKQLLPMREENGVIKPAQALVPWKFRDQKDKLVNITDFTKTVKGRVVIDTQKLPEEVLQLFGMRIPNQGPNSQSWIEIVGFLPEKSGDLIVATKDYVVQMGSDFDVDKLYTYMYNTYVDAAGSLRVHRSEKTDADKKAALQNKILDIHIAIHKNSNEKVQKQIATPLGFWELPNLATEVTTLRDKRIAVKGEEDYFTGLSDQYQRDKFKNATAGKAGVGVFSLDSMFNAIAQGKELKYIILEENRYVPLTVQFGERKSDGDLSGELALDEKTYKSDVIAGYQSAAVDNEKEQILDKLNINNHTFKVIKILNQLGFTEEVPLFISQDIIVDYVKILEKLGSSLTGYTPNQEQEAFMTVLKMDKYQTTLEEVAFPKLAEEQATPKKLREYIEKGDTAPNYREAQVALLTKFRELNRYGQEIQTLQSTINPDSAGLGKSVMESMLKEEQVYELLSSPIANASKLIGDLQKIKPEDEAKYIADGYIIRRKQQGMYAFKPETINGHAIGYGLMTNNDLWNRFFYYDSPAIQSMFEKIENLTTDESNKQIKSKAENRHAIWKEMKSFIYTDDELEMHDTNVTSERERLLYDRWERNKNVLTHTKESLAFVIQKIQDTEFGRDNALMNVLEVDIKKDDGPSSITYRASSAENADETAIYAAFLDGLQQTVPTAVAESGAETPTVEPSPVVAQFNGKDYTMRELIQDLIIYAYLTGGVQEAAQYVKYIPAAYLTTMPFGKILSNRHNVEAKLPYTKLDRPLEFYNNPPFVEQYIQHHPERTVQVVLADMIAPNAKQVAKVSSFKLKGKKLDNIGLTFEGNRYEPPYVSVSAGTSETGLRLFKFDTTTSTYKQIDTLGAFASSEYNANTPLQRTLIRRNKSTIPTSEQPRGTTPHTPVGVKDAPLPRKQFVKTSIISKLAKGTQKEIVYMDGVEKSKEMLNEIINVGANPYHVVLAEEILPYMDKIPSTMRLVIKKGKRDGKGAFYRYVGKVDHEFIMYSNSVGAGTFTGASEIVLHELIHGLTGYKLSYYIYDKGTDPTSLQLAKQFREAMPGIALNKKEEAAVKSIQVLMNQVKQTILKDPKKKAAFNIALTKLRKEEGLSTAEIDEFYGLSDIREFVTMALTNAEFQKMLNEIEAPSGKTFWKALKERLMRLLNAMGIEIAPGSVLEATVHDVLDLVIQPDQVGEEELLEGMSEGEEKTMDMVFPDQFDNVVSGKKTQTTRENKNNYKVGDNLTIKNKEGDIVRAIVTYVKPVDNITLIHNLPENDEYFKLEGREGDKAYFVKNTQYLKSKKNVVTIGFSLINEKEGKYIEKVFESYGTYYKFVLDKEGIPVEGHYSQGNPNDWNPLNRKSMVEKYNELFVAEKRDMSERTKDDNQLELPDGRIITFSDEQYNGLNMIREWMKGDDTFFTLSGYAGTGKTTIIKKIIDEHKGSVIVSAPTHAAVNQVIETTEQQGSTLHKLLGLQPHLQLDEFDPNNPIFKQTSDPTINEYSLVVIDEASMINKGLLKMIEETVDGRYTKVIFMGDEAQIPPIKEAASPVFMKKPEANFFQLTQTQRLTGGNPLGLVYDKIRNNLRKPDGGFERKTMLNSKGEGVIFTNRQTDFRTAVLNAFNSNEFKDDVNHAKVIAWQNATVGGANKVIRESIFGKDADRLEKGDVLMGYRSIKDKYTMVIKNAVIYKVTERSELTKSDRGLDGWDITIEYKDEGKMKTENVFVVDPTNPENIEKYTEIHNRLERAPVAQGNKKLWAHYYAFRRNNVIMEAIPRIVNGKSKPIVKDLDYGYAITAHKAQGSTYKHVFVMESDIDQNSKVKERNQIKYVAMSRPTHTATVLTDRATEQKNTFVDKPIPAPPPMDDPTDAGDTVKGMPNDDGVIGQDGSILSKTLVVDAEVFVTDGELDKFIKRCKG